MSKQITVDDRVLFAADRMYDAIDNALTALASCPTVPRALDGLRFQLQRAKDRYDAAISEEVPR